MFLEAIKAKFWKQSIFETVLMKLQWILLVVRNTTWQVSEILKENETELNQKNLCLQRQFCNSKFLNLKYILASLTENSRAVIN